MSRRGRASGNGSGRRLGAALAAGAIAIAVNTLALKAADLIHLATAKGGLLRLVTLWFHPFISLFGLANAVRTPAFQTAFHVVVGLGMAVVYAYVVEPILATRAWIKGAIYAVAVWILNAAVVLPATGEGFAGSAHLGLAGMTWFAVAHTLFFVLLAVLYERFGG